MNKIKNLPSCELSEDLFNKVLELFGYKQVDSLSEVMATAAYDTVYYDGGSRLICKQEWLEYANYKLTGNYELTADRRQWRQFICRKNFDQEDSFKTEITPITAKSMIYKWLHKAGLDNDQIDDRLSQFECDQGEGQIHMRWFTPTNYISKFSNCVYYDINKAHRDALIEIFPEIKDDLTNCKYKQVPNFFVGLLNYKTEKQKAENKPAKHARTYNWIVERTSTLLKKRIEEISTIGKSKIVYANTDGVIIQNPTKIIPASTVVGEFKIEATGDVYLHNTGHGTILQYYDLDGNKVIKAIGMKKTHALMADLSIGKSVNVIDRNKDIVEIKENVEVKEI